MDNRLNYFRIGDLVMVDGFPRNITWIGNSYPRVEIDDVDVACKVEDIKQIPVNSHFLEMNGWKKGKYFRNLYIPFTKGNYEVRENNGGGYSLHYFGNQIKKPLRSISQLQHILAELTFDDGGDIDDVTIFKYN